VSLQREQIEMLREEVNLLKNKVYGNEQRAVFWTKRPEEGNLIQTAFFRDPNAAM